MSTSSPLNKPLVSACPAEIPAMPFPIVYTVEEAQVRARQEDKAIVVLFATRRGGVSTCNRY